MAAIFTSVSSTRPSRSSTLRAQVGDLGAVIGDELQVRLAAAADLVDALDFGLHRLHERLALGDGLDLLLDASRCRGPAR